MPTETAANNYTNQQLAEKGGAAAVWAELYTRLWEEYLTPLRDGRPYIVQIRQHPPSLVYGSNPAETTFAIRAYFCLANPHLANVGEVVHPSCMPPSDIDDGPPITTTIGVKRFARTDEGWERMPDQ